MTIDSVTTTAAATTTTTVCSHFFLETAFRLIPGCHGGSSLCMSTYIIYRSFILLIL